MPEVKLLTGGAICQRPPTGAGFLQACAAGPWPRLELLGTHVPKRLKKAIRDSTSYLEHQRPSNARGLKALIDRAAPATSFLPVGEDRYRSADGTWTIDLLLRHGGYELVVKRNGRRVGDRCSRLGSRRAADRAVINTIEGFAKA